jgi:hypothetical protein
MEFVCGLGGLIIGAIIGWVLCNNQNNAQKGMVTAMTVKACKQVLMGTMESPEFHAAVMCMVHPKEDPTSGFEFSQPQAQDMSQFPSMTGRTPRRRLRRA